MKDILNEIVDWKRRENEHLGRLFDGRELHAMVDRQCRDTPPSLARAVAESDHRNYSRVQAQVAFEGMD